MFDEFRFINSNATNIRLVVRGHGGLGESWCFFAAQPAPTPPPWCRYSTKTEPNQHIIVELPSAEEDHSCGGTIVPTINPFSLNSLAV